MDWRDGSIDRTYPVRCYREALANLPEDLVVYSSAASDISRALAQRVARTPAARDPAAARELEGVSGGGAPVPALIAAALAVAVLAVGSVGAVLQRRKR